MSNEELFKKGLIEELYQQNIGFFHYISNKFNNTGIEYDERISLCNIAFVKTIKTYNGSTLFATYYYKIAVNEILMCYRKNKKIKEISYEVKIDNGEFLNLTEIVPDKTDIEKEYIEREQEIRNCKKIIEHIDKLKVRERQIIKMYIEGYKQSDIGESVGLSQAYIAREIKKISKKLIRIRNLSERAANNEKFFS